MARIEVRVPSVGESTSEVLVSRWHKQPGERVERNEILFELETDKVDVELGAEAAGRLVEIFVREGQKAAPGDLIAVIETDAGVPFRGASAPSAPATGRAPEVACLRCGTRLETAHSAGGRMAFAGEPVRLLVCRRCGHVEMLAENPARF